MTSASKATPSAAFGVLSLTFYFSNQRRGDDHSIETTIAEPPPGYFDELSEEAAGL